MSKYEAKLIGPSLPTSFTLEKLAQNHTHRYALSNFSGHALGLDDAGRILASVGAPRCTPVARGFCKIIRHTEALSSWDVYELVEATPKLEDEFTPEQVRALEAWKRD